MKNNMLQFLNFYQTKIYIIAFQTINDWFHSFKLTAIFVYFQTGPVEIVPGLYLGDSQHSAQVGTLRDIGITSLLNVSTSCKNLFENEFEYMTIPVNDNDSANLSSWFNEAIHYIGK